MAHISPYGRTNDISDFDAVMQGLEEQDNSIESPVISSSFSSKQDDYGYYSQPELNSPQKESIPRRCILSPTRRFSRGDESMHCRIDVIAEAARQRSPSVAQSPPEHDKLRDYVLSPTRRLSRGDLALLPSQSLDRSSICAPPTPSTITDTYQENRRDFNMLPPPSGEKKPVTLMKSKTEDTEMESIPPRPLTRHEIWNVTMSVLAWACTISNLSLGKRTKFS